MTDENSAPISYVTVEVYDQVYHLSGQDEDHIRAPAARVDAKMRAPLPHRAAPPTRCASQSLRRSTWRMRFLSLSALIQPSPKKLTPIQHRISVSTRALGMPAPSRFAGCWTRYLKTNARPGLSLLCVPFNHRCYS